MGSSEDIIPSPDIAAYSGINISPDFEILPANQKKLFPSPLSFVRENHAEPSQKLFLSIIFEGLIERFV